MSQLNAITGEDLSAAFSIPQWQALATEEKHQSELFSRLVGLQDEIITTLLTGSRADSAEMQEILHQAREVQETLLVADKQAANIRAELVSL